MFIQRIRLQILLGFCAFFVFLSDSLALRVVIDPGHGGNDAGAVRGSLRESDIVLSVSQLLAQRLRSQPGFEVFLTRPKDHYMTLEKRTEYARKNDGDVFISIHVNAAPQNSIHGFEIYFQNQLPPNEEALLIASLENNFEGENTTQTRALENKNDVANIIEDLKRQHRMKRSFHFAKEVFYASENLSLKSIRQAPFYVISEVPMPSILVELGFISHPQENKKLQSINYQNQLAENLFQALINFKEIADQDKN